MKCVTILMSWKVFKFCEITEDDDVKISLSPNLKFIREQRTMTMIYGNLGWEWKIIILEDWGAGGGGLTRNQFAG